MFSAFLHHRYHLLSCLFWQFKSTRRKQWANESLALDFLVLLGSGARNLSSLCFSFKSQQRAENVVRIFVSMFDFPWKLCLNRSAFLHFPFKFFFLSIFCEWKWMKHSLPTMMKGWKWTRAKLDLRLKIQFP